MNISSCKERHYKDTDPLMINKITPRAAVRQPPKSLDNVRDKIRLKHYSIRTEQAYGLPDKTRAEENEASGQLNPPQKPFGGAIQPAADPSERGEDVVAAFHRLTNPANARSALAPRRGLQAEAGGSGARPAGTVAVGAVGLGRGPAADIEFQPGLGRSRWRHDPRGEQRLGMATVVGLGGGHDHPQWASPDRRTRVARRSRIGPGPPGKARCVRPFFCWLLGAVGQDLIPVDPVQPLVPFGQLPPGLMEHI